MASRKTHLYTAIIFWIITMVFTFIIKGYNFTYRKDSLWILLGFTLVIWGAEFPDMDQMFRKIFNHRDWLLHSAIPPAVLSLLALLTSSQNNPNNFNAGLLPVIAMFNIGVASHFIMDWLPTWSNPDENGILEVKDFKYALGWTFEGLTGDELVQKLVGTYLIHFPFTFGKEKRKTLGKNGTRAYLIFNAFILLGLAYYMVWIYAHL